ncbi:GNAT family N-acetyltransferase [Thalassobacillus hwangdonensis]|uniref:GNAT family N-acetyltransferase n=1 Tax=Thalassobacillus hwangdonensis TaxID=546108 RepID=A0ABW3L3V0_9BACI
MIREAGLEDAAELARLITLLGYPTSPEEMASRFAKIHMKPDYQTYVYEEDERLVGMIGMIHSFHYEKNDTYIRVVAAVVEADRRGKGIGKSLFMHAMRWGHRKGAKAIVLNSGNRKERQETHEIYRKWGFEGAATGFYKKITTQDLGLK